MNFLLAIGIGSLIIFFLMQLVGVAGVRTGVPFPVWPGRPFGIWGANFRQSSAPSSRAFGTAAQTAAALGRHRRAVVRNESLLQFHQSSHMLGHSTLELVCYVVVWGLQLLIIQNGMGDGSKVSGLGRSSSLGDGCCCCDLSRRQAGGFSFQPHDPDGRVA